MKKITDRNRKEKRLIAAANSVRSHSYSPYSGYAVGAAVLTADRGGRIYTGCNVENISYGATICAERVALGCAISGGARKFSMMAIVVGGKEPAPPCGLCLQFMDELCLDLSIILVAADSGKTKRTTLRRLLPERFRFEP